MQLDEIPQRIALIFQDAVDNIRFFKRQQWTVMMFTATAFGALYAAAAVFDGASKLLLVVATVAVALLAASFLNSYRASLAKFRARIRWIYEHHFPYQERQGLGLGKEKSHANKVGYNSSLISLVFVGMALAIVAIVLA